MAIGNMGPRRKPMNETAMALPIRDGMNHIVNSKLFDWMKSSAHNLSRKIGSETYPIARNA